MTDLLLATLAVALLAVLAGAAFLLLVVAPFVVAVGRGERRGLSAARVGAVQLALTGVALLLALRLRDTPLLVPPLALTWVLPVLLGALAPKALGASGRHEP